MASLSRKIEFYWLNVKPDAIREKFEEIKALPLDLKEEKNSFFPVSAEEIYLSMRFPEDIPEEAKNTETYGTICYVRKSNLPHIDTKGVESKIPIGDDANGLLEKAHFFMAPFTIGNDTSTILLLEISRVAPGIIMFFKYLCYGNAMSELMIYRLLKKNAFAELTGKKGVYQIDIEVRKGASSLVPDEAASLKELIENVEKADAQTERIILSVQGKGATLNEDFSDTVIAHIKKFGKNMFKKARIKYISNEGRKKYVDLLEGNYDKNVSAQTEERNDRYLNSKSMFNALLRLYNREKAALIGLDAVLICQKEQEVKINDEEVEE
ncbi:hypothetical protein [Cloacibacillus sp.]|uniref:hypothetical protein n=1 Tax=Cloacibacillus sp. TaxID=2049023 RepID=UPI0025C6C7A8|nr:hypothetical protein [Cloacibacillus sp.]MCC8057318.1 hypothetical protein [Cloacibacillus sp.]